ncbi:RagB/SusD family nutrient uptake outer membrane protein [Desertivirga arenae]|uniref:RagB/SusD family nutrient uptake outer membrane protein n=1 Tax=Desertivirga arenae TaxID=2810309 RepID=UPI001A95944C|nr:RagB/SusD family nutrient uptake outer membrane protein [Pedobacter sp. SYSU D00823]
MQRIYKILALTGLVLTASCDKILDETPRDRFEPGFFKTEAGVKGGLTGLYSGLRRLYGQPYYYNATETGTDEYTYGSQADGNFRAADLSGLGIPDAQNSRWDVLWNTAYANINSSSGIIANGTEANMPVSLLAEARFFRSFSYFLLVQTFGGVPLDLGGGILEYNTTPTISSKRNTVPEVYTLGVFPDLIKAVADLPDNPRVTGAITKNVARLTLAKAYLTYGWWLQNPNSIPTYPEVGRTDPDGHDAAWYFQKAYDTAVEGINSPGPYALQATYYDVNLAQNDRNKEIMLWADHTEANAQYSESNITGWDGGNGQNQAGWMTTWYFQNIKASSNPTTWSPVDAMFRTVQAGQSYSRPWMRMTPPIDVFTKTFSDKTQDSRFNGTFTTVYRGTWHLNTARTEQTLYGANFLPISKNGKVLSFLPSDPGGINYSTSTVFNDNTEAGFLAGRADYVVPLDKISRNIYPGLWKLGAYRKSTDYNDDKIASSRPFNILKFSEFYFVAAEAAVKGATVRPGQSARELINVIRARAGKWKFDVAENVARVEDNSAALTNATPTVIDINYILDERSREYFGEGYRWHDLARTQKWEEYAGSYRISATAGAAPTTVQRTLPKYLYLRPIPQGQIDQMDAASKVGYQNPGYQ